MKYGLNKINIRLNTQQVGWLGGKRVQLHPWGPRIKLFVMVNDGILNGYSFSTYTT
jgi:hypothetical protein